MKNDHIMIFLYHFFIYILHDCCFVHYIDVNNVLLHLNNNNNTSIDNDVGQKKTYNK